MLKFQDEKKAGVWREHVRSQGVSGISQKQFCTRNDLNHARFGYWKRRLATSKAAKNSAAPDRLFVPVTERVGNQHSFLKILFPTGVSLECTTTTASKKRIADLLAGKNYIEVGFKFSRDFHLPPGRRRQEADKHIGRIGRIRSRSTPIRRTLVCFYQSPTRYRRSAD